VLNQFKLNPETRHIPVQLLSVEEERQHGLAHGAFSYLVKPATTLEIEQAFDRLKDYTTFHTRRLLIVEDNDIERDSIVELLKHDDIDIVAVATGAEALTALQTQRFDCCVVDLRLPYMSGFDLLDIMQREPVIRDTPVVSSPARRSRTTTRCGSDRSPRVSSSRTQSPERLFDETALFLHQSSRISRRPSATCAALHSSDDVLHDRRVLIVDDDARNIFALTTVLEHHGMEVISAANGRHAVDLLHRADEMNIVLMDIMMPEQDGYETMKEIRRSHRFRTLPILALTAKAMKGDREKCLNAGASDYIAKPVNTEQLLSLMRVWLHR
jgi:CheY-like chemotaxis protein